jgi:DNA-binding MarR family transcriptional regulator
MNFFDVLVRYEVDLWAVVDGALRRAGECSAAQLQAMGAIEGRGGDARVLDVSTDLGITPGAASKVVDRLEREGLVVRRANPADRRSSLVDLTQEGAAALAAGRRVRDAVLDTVLEPEAAASALRALEVLSDRVKQAQVGVTV